VEPTGTHQCAAAITTRPGEHHHPLATGIAGQEAAAGQMCQIVPGVLHHLDQFDVVVLDHRPIHFDHLISR
jgi:hypothetical protein